MEDEPRQWNTAWRCAICGEIFEPSGRGMNQLKLHASDAHALNPGVASDGIVDLETGEVLQGGWGPQVLRAAARRGWTLDSSKGYTEPGKLPEPDGFKPAGGRKAVGPLSRKEKAALALAEQTGRTIMRDVVISRQVEHVFYEAQGLWPELYGGNSVEEFSRFLTEFVVGYAIMSGMPFGRLLAQEMASTLAGEQTGEQEVEDDGDAE
jgi:hypothetical protein